jgi:RimJ/RimL family protein N-acetyltransferase
MPMMPIPTTFGDIRPWSSLDAGALAKYANNRKIWLNLTDGFPHPYTIENAHDFLGMVAAQNPTSFFAIATDGEAIGGIGVSLHQDVYRLTAEMGYWLAEPYWGRGIMTEAVAAFAGFAFAAFGLLRIYARPYARNVASCRVLEKAGFVCEGCLRSSVIKDGVILDQMLYAQVRSSTE